MENKNNIVSPIKNSGAAVKPWAFMLDGSYVWPEVRQWGMALDATKAAKAEGMPFLARLNHAWDIKKSMVPGKMPQMIRVLGISALLRADEVDKVGDISFSGPTTAAFRNSVVKAWEDFSPELRKLLLKAGVTPKAGRTASDILPEWTSRQISSGYHEEFLLNHSMAFYAPDYKYIVIPEYYLRRTQDQRIQKEPTAANLSLGVYGFMPPRFVASGMRHETMHAVDDLPNFFGLPRVSNNIAFIEAYQKDLHRLGGIEGARREYDYYVQNGSSAGRSETFAELGAEAAGGSVTGPQMARDWPHTFKFMQNFKRDLEQAARSGPVAVILLFRQLSSGLSPHLGYYTSSEWKNIDDEDMLEMMLKDRSYKVEDFQRWIDVQEPAIGALAINQMYAQRGEEYTNYSRYLLAVLSDPGERGAIFEDDPQAVNKLLLQAMNAGDHELAEGIVAGGYATVEAAASTQMPPRPPITVSASSATLAR